MQTLGHAYRKRTADIRVADAEATEPSADRRSSSTVCNCASYCNQEVSAGHNMPGVFYANGIVS